MKTSNKLKLLGALLGATLLSATVAVADSGRSVDSYGDKAFDHEFAHSDTSMVVQKKSNSEFSISKYKAENDAIFDDVMEDNENF